MLVCAGLLRRNNLFYILYSVFCILYSVIYILFAHVAAMPDAIDVSIVTRFCFQPCRDGARTKGEERARQRWQGWCRRAWHGIPGSAGFEPQRHLLLRFDVLGYQSVDRTAHTHERHRLAHAVPVGIGSGLGLGLGLGLG